MNQLTLMFIICSTVALNFQTPCKEMDLNQGCFLPNGRSGYKLKPEFLRNPTSQFDSVNLGVGPWLNKKQLHIMVRPNTLCENKVKPIKSALLSKLTGLYVVSVQVISAQQLPKLNVDKQSSIVDPLVKVEICGIQADNAMQQTHHINNNGKFSASALMHSKDI